jgi:hypothetical protein
MKLTLDADVRQAQRQLRALPKVAKDPLSRAQRETATAIVAGMKARVSVSARAGREHLRDVIGMRVSPARAEAVVGVPKPYLSLAYWLEFGTVRMSARPFFTPAVESEASAHASRTNQALADALRAIEQET